MGYIYHINWWPQGFLFHRQYGRVHQPWASHHFRSVSGRICQTCCPRLHWKAALGGLATTYKIHLEASKSIKFKRTCFPNQTMLFKHKHLILEFWALLFSFGFYTFLPVTLWYFYNPFSLAPRQSVWCRDGPYKHRCLGSWCPPSDEN